MTVTQSRELAEVVDRVKGWPLEMRISLARRILETVEAPAIVEPPRTLPLDQVIGLLNTTLSTEPWFAEIVERA